MTRRSAISTSPRIPARKARDGAPYEFGFTPPHLDVLRFIANRPGCTDEEISLRSGVASAGSYRSRLRDAGMVSLRKQEGAVKFWEATYVGLVFLAGTEMGLVVAT